MPVREPFHLTGRTDPSDTPNFSLHGCSLEGENFGWLGWVKACLQACTCFKAARPTLVVEPLEPEALKRKLQQGVPLQEGSEKVHHFLENKQGKPPKTCDY